MLRSVLRLSSVIAAVTALLVMAVLGVDHARAQIRQSPKANAEEGDFTIYDTPQATLLLDRASGNLWRIGYTEVAGQRYWFSTYVPREPAITFSEFQNRLRKEMRSAPRERTP